MSVFVSVRVNREASIVLPEWSMWAIVWWTGWFLMMLEWWNVRGRYYHPIGWVAWTIIFLIAGFIPVYIVAYLVYDKIKG